MKLDRLACRTYSCRIIFYIYESFLLCNLARQVLFLFHALDLSHAFVWCRGHREQNRKKKPNSDVDWMLAP